MSSPILVTGAAGFVGARFVEACNARDQDVISVDDLSFFSERDEHRDLNFGRVIDRPDLAEYLSDKPHFRAIVHLGAVTATTELDSKLLKERNLDCSKLLWRFAAKHGIPFVYASSAATYGNGDAGYSDQESRLERLRPLNPYGLSKHRFDLWALKQEKTPPTWAGFKLFNVYGFGERHKGSMASVALQAYDQILSRGSVRLFKSYREGIADGKQARDFVSVEDVVKVLWFSIEKPLKRGIFNLGTGRARTFLDFSRAVFKALKKSPQIEFIEMPMEIRERYQYFTEAKMQKLARAGYANRFLSLERGVQRYVDRLRAFYGG